MRESKFKLDFSNNTVVWYDKEMSFHACNNFGNNVLIKKVISNEPTDIAEAYNAQSQPTAYVDSAKKYEETNTSKLYCEQVHFNKEVCSKLEVILQSNKKLFEYLEGKALEIFPDSDFCIELILGPVPFHFKKPYSIPLH